MTVAAYTTSGESLIFPYPIMSTRNPTTSDIMDQSGAPYRVGQLWGNTGSLAFYAYGGAGNWVLLGSGSTGSINSITGDSGGAEVPLAGNFNLLGSNNQITVTGTANQEKFSIPSTFIAPGSIAAAAGNITATNGNVVLGTAGNKLVSTSVGTTTAAGANSIGSVTLVAGTATVATTAVTANSLIVVWRQSIGATTGALGMISVGPIVAATSFVINAALTATATSLATTDVSVVGYIILN
jgi:hypothetical protein